MDGKKVGRREFLGYTGIAGLAGLALASGCHGALYTNLIRDCRNENYDGLRVRVMSYNIANARGNHEDLFKKRDRKAIISNLDQIARMAAYEGIDVLCMNEVDFSSSRTHNIDQAEHIAKGLCYNHVIKDRMFSIPGMLDLGNAIVSRYPLKLNSHRQYGDGFCERIKHIFKSYVDFDVLLDSALRLNFTFTHLDHHSSVNREREAVILLEHIRNKREPFVLLGDFNSGRGSSAFDMITGSGLVHNQNIGYGKHMTYPSDRPRHSIDHILVSSQLGIGNYRTIWAEMSDHRPIMGDVSFQEGAGQQKP
jgi:endonuclease/exonuclease/phosphatase family metal-dependent hydrolase